MRKLLVAAVAVGILAMGGMAPPASAAAVGFADPEGDANGFFYTDNRVPLPSEPSLDITKVTITSDGKKLTYTAHIKQLADQAPPPSTGYYFRLGYTYERWMFRFEVLDDATGTGVFFTSPEDPAGTELSCNGCTGRVDRRASTVVVTAPIASMSAGMREWQPAIRPAKAGSELTRFEVVSQRSIVLLTASCDVALSRADVVLTL